MKKLLLTLILVSCTCLAYAQDPGEPTTYIPAVFVQWNDEDMVPIESVTGISLVSHQVLDEPVGNHNFVLITLDQWPREMTWEAELPESTVEAPKKIQFVLQVDGLPTTNPPRRWWAKLSVQLQLKIWEGTSYETFLPSEPSNVVYVIDWVGKRTGKPKRIG